MYETSPQDVHPMTTLTLMSRKHDLGDIFYLDNWPAASHVQMVLNSPVSSHYASHIREAIRVRRISQLRSLNSILCPNTCYTGTLWHI